MAYVITESKFDGEYLYTDPIYICETEERCIKFLEDKKRLEIMENDIRNAIASSDPRQFNANSLIDVFFGKNKLELKFEYNSIIYEFREIETLE